MDRKERAARLATLRHILRQLRKDQGLTQLDVARELKVPQSFVSNYENGEKRLDLAELERVAQAINVTLLSIVKIFCRTP